MNNLERIKEIKQMIFLSDDGNIKKQLFVPKPKPEDIQILNDAIMEHAKQKKGMRQHECR